jgi:hypothetical protein
MKDKLKFNDILDSLKDENIINVGFIYNEKENWKPRLILIDTNKTETYIDGFEDIMKYIYNKIK